MTIFLGTGSFNRTDLYNIHNVVQNTQLSFPKEFIIGMLRDVFSQDSYYHYVSDEWGFPLTPDHTNLPLGAGTEDDSTTRVYIGEFWRYDIIYYPAIIVKNGGSRYVPIAMNRNRETIKYTKTLVVDGYNNVKAFHTASKLNFAGAWEGAISIDILARGLRERDDLVELVSLICTDIRFDEFLRAGILMKGVSAGSPSEIDDRNDKLYKQTVTLDVRTEWRREIPVEDIIDAINICVDFGNLQTSPPVLAPNIGVSTEVTLLDEIASL